MRLENAARRAERDVAAASAWPSDRKFFTYRQSSPSKILASLATVFWHTAAMQTVISRRSHWGISRRCPRGSDVGGGSQRPTWVREVQVFALTAFI